MRYSWVFVRPDGSGWTVDSLGQTDAEYAFPENKLDDVLESFYESAGPYPFDFELLIVEEKPKTREAVTAKLRRPKKRKT